MYQRAFAVSVMRGVSFVSLIGPGSLGAVELHAAHTEHGQDGDGEHDDAHASQPLQLLAVEEESIVAVRRCRRSP